MRPDSQKTGSIDSAVNAETISLQANKSELPANAIQAETQPTLGSSSGSGTSSGTTTTDQTQKVPPSLVKDEKANQQQESKGYFESQITQLPAEEQDKIEQAWVDKAEEIEQKAANDPYSEDEAQHALSRAYLKKRFNIDVE